MIIVRIWEGLGNQLFQYAYARSLQERIQMQVYLDVRHCNKGDLPFEKKDIVRRKLGIQHFNISLKKLDINKIPSLGCIDGKNGLPDKVKYLLLRKNIGRWNIVSDGAECLDIHQDILKPEKFSYINAHCVNRRYYSQYRNILLQELQLKNGIKISETLNEIMVKRNTVSVHIRLTDYLKNPSVICRQNYYDKAMRYIKDKVDRPYFLIFTDDSQMARKMYQFEDDTYWISEEDFADYEELIIMSRCKHNIIAYSTFSYWGAWLNQNQDKIIIAPGHMFGGNLYEKGWKVI